MQEVDKIILNFIDELDYEDAKLMFSHIKSGKKLRTKLILSIANLKNPSGATWNEIYKLCAIVELIHLASLLHDDVIDEASLRRGAKSINAEFGAKNAIMLGDILYSKAFFELSSFDKELAKSISNAVLCLSKGELMDINLSKSFNLDKEKYLKMLYFKTAVLIEASAKSAAFLVGLEPQDFADYGKNLGLAFQMVDDILDIRSDEKTLGKPAMSDFREGKTTLPYIFLYQKLDENDKIKLQNLFKKELDSTQLAWLRQKLNLSLDESLQEAKNYANLALKAIEKYQSPFLNEIVSKMVDRDF
ncbi:octaprenyl-diphosphate synthase [Campylobacter sp. MIT 99-7217]|uniref:polyprenyl synthetase family protein n=1 Tax=Campylobacter sp. MIT 99-7217 TaxID=535091 RepID=UPI00115A4FBC|nr:polyprenyl synthetase family protein [Campylobacter sp. MIT 99-7217]TQR31840.1 octaprenyl-diphosphate synthase [Campylobacter sp. MIT 99-7217]